MNNFYYIDNVNADKELREFFVADYPYYAIVIELKIHHILFDGTLKEWLDNCGIDGIINGAVVGFRREEDRNLFILRWDTHDED